MNYSFNVPINSVSFGAVSIALLYESFKLGHHPCIFPIGNQVDTSAQIEDKEFSDWLVNCINKSYKNHQRDIPVIKLWHISNGIESVSNKQILISFYECDSPTTEELNVIKNNYKVIFPCDYNTNIFKEFGCNNVKTIPIGFDSRNFKKLDKTFLTDRITFGLPSKFEPVRKRHVKVIKAWLKKYGNNPKFFLNCAIH